MFKIGLQNSLWLYLIYKYDRILFIIIFNTIYLYNRNE